MTVADNLNMAIYFVIGVPASIVLIIKRAPILLVLCMLIVIVNMLFSFDFFEEVSHSDYMDLPPEQLSNRKYLREVMVKNGFMPLKEEWWHYTLKDEPCPNTYFTFPNQRLKELNFFCCK
ncbi:MAG: hypothetical protein II833_02725 [Pseudobutyrivibrio sp.]|nr:hypothetical protein [Pseudobutyrivibrio sp.]